MGRTRSTSPGRAPNVKRPRTWVMASSSRPSRASGRPEAATAIATSRPVKRWRIMVVRSDGPQRPGVVWGALGLLRDGLILDGGQVHVANVFLDHPPRAEARKHRPHRLLDHLQPAARRARAVA